MNIDFRLKMLGILFCVLVISGCQAPNMVQTEIKPLSVLKGVFKSSTSGTAAELTEKQPEVSALSSVLVETVLGNNTGSDFSTVIRYALKNDPMIVARRQNADARLAAVGYIEAQKDFIVSSTFYGGIEDLTDDTKGMAVSVDASRLVYDGGMVDSQIDAARFIYEAAEFDLLASIDERAFRLGQLWIEVEKYQTLKTRIESRLAVLDPLIEQLETVAEAGVGDVSKVTAAQRTVSTIRLAETDVSDRLAQAKLEFFNAYGGVKSEISYDSTFIASLLPEQISESLVRKSPLILSQYANYKAALARVSAARAKNDFNIGFQVKATKPFAGSEYEADESIGIVARKTLFNDKAHESEVKELEAEVAELSANIRFAFREAVREIKTAEQNIVAMDNAMVVAGKNAEITAEEVVYLKQQLIIGGSTLDSVLSAEARLYEAEANEINFLAEKQKSELAIVTSLGLFSRQMQLQ